MKREKGFTIVELLVVIVVIGVLAAITIVAFSGVSQKAIVASLQSDLNNDANQLKMYHVEYDVYPSAINNDTKCPTLPDADTQYCLKASSGTTLSYSGGGQSFTITATKNGITYTITENSGPTPTIQITAIAPISGTPQVGELLTAGVLTPVSAAVIYQWQSATTSNGAYSNIVGATSSTYTIVSTDIDKYIKVTATGTGAYSGSVTSLATTQVPDPNWKVVGTQTWAMANLNVGTMIANTATQTNNSVLEKYCYSNQESNCTTFGGLYQWDEMMQYVTTEGAQGICPTGSHVPSDSDWKNLGVNLGMTQAQADENGWRGTDQGTQLKIGGSSGLNLPLAGGRHYSSTSFFDANSYGYYWTSTQDGSSYAWHHYLYSGNSTAGRASGEAKSSGYSVRCVQD